jgi:N-acetylglucosamine-6-sulfatase
MRRLVPLLTSVALAIVLLWAAYTGGSVPTADAQTTSKPSFVFILADDMRKDNLKYMPKTRSLLAQRGMSFTNAYVSNATCCPSRATIMRGQYSHNTGVWHNGNSSRGGWRGYKSNGNEQDNIATRLDRAGYRTGLLGKYLNNYKGTSKPPGWDDWFAASGHVRYYDYEVNDNGTIRQYGTNSGAYSTDVLKRQTLQFIDASVDRRRPFFAYVAPKPPHGPFPASIPRHQHDFDGEKAPRLPSFNERDVSDKPPVIRSLPRLGPSKIAKINRFHEGRVESLQALDELVKAVVNKLRATNRLSNTYIVFTSDNGWHQGEHRIPRGKWRPYEESIHVPLLVRGPGVQAGATSGKLVLNTDYFPTFTDFANITTPNYVDGRSLRPLLKGRAATWQRTAILLETPRYYGIRTSTGKKYIEHKSGFRELYDLNTGPYELHNSYKTAAPRDDVASRLQALKGCSRDECRTAENRQP